eukprot:2302691-Prymnesium_polylepis.2
MRVELACSLSGSSAWAPSLSSIPRTRDPNVLLLRFMRTRLRRAAPSWVFFGGFVWGHYAALSKLPPRGFILHTGYSAVNKRIAKVLMFFTNTMCIKHPPTKGREHPTTHRHPRHVACNRNAGVHLEIHQTHTDRQEGDTLLLRVVTRPLQREEGTFCLTRVCSCGVQCSAKQKIRRKPKHVTMTTIAGR